MSYFLHRCTPRLTIRNDIVRPSPPSLTAQECDHELTREVLVLTATV